MIIIFAYQCNLRSHLTNVQYEKPIKTIQDILERGQNLYISIPLRRSYMSGAYPKGSLVAKILELSDKSPENGLYPLNSSFLPDEIAKDVMENGAIFIKSNEVLTHQYFVNKVTELSRPFFTDCPSWSVGSSQEKFSIHEWTCGYHWEYLCHPKVHSVGWWITADCPAGVVLLAYMTMMVPN